MRNLILFLYIILKFSLLAQNIDNQTINALCHISSGYILYGVSELKEAARTNDIAAQYFLAGCYSNGIGVELDYIEAFKLYRKSAERGLTDSQYYLSKFYNEGKGVYKNTVRGNEWLNKFNKKGGKLSLPDICLIHQNGLKYPDNYSLNPLQNINSDSNNQSISKSESDLIQRETVNVNVVNLQLPALPVSSNNTETKKSEVDLNIPVNTIKNEKSFALIIANENYHDVAKVPNAINDGEIFAEYCKKTLGFPESNIHLVKDATFNNIKRELNLISKISEAYNGESNIIVYYAGHGIPDESNGSAYILPIDGYGSDLTTCYSLANLYSTLNNLSANKVIVLIDACFSGSLRGDGMLISARGVAIKSKQNKPQGKVVVFSAAQGDETAYAYDEQYHGLFTFYLLKKIKDTNGNMTLGELASFLTDNVTKKSLIIHGKSQTPTVSFSPVIQNDWKNWNLQ